MTPDLILHHYWTSPFSEKVRLILGHKKLDTTALYTRVFIEDLREVLARAHPRERGKRRGSGR